MIEGCKLSEEMSIMKTRTKNKHCKLWQITISDDDLVETPLSLSYINCLINIKDIIKCLKDDIDFPWYSSKPSHSLVSYQHSFNKILWNI